MNLSLKLTNKFFSKKLTFEAGLTKKYLRYLLFHKLPWTSNHSRYFFPSKYDWQVNFWHKSFDPFSQDIKVCAFKLHALEKVCRFEERKSSLHFAIFIIFCAILHILVQYLNLTWTLDGYFCGTKYFWKGNVLSWVKLLIGSVHLTFFPSYPFPLHFLPRDSLYSGKLSKGLYWNSKTFKSRSA